MGVSNLSHHDIHDYYKVYAHRYSYGTTYLGWLKLGNCGSGSAHLSGSVFPLTFFLDWIEHVAIGLIYSKSLFF